MYRQGQHAQNRRDGGHQNGPEPLGRCLQNRFITAEVMGFPQLVRQLHQDDRLGHAKRDRP